MKTDIFVRVSYRSDARLDDFCERLYRSVVTEPGTYWAVRAEAPDGFDPDDVVISGGATLLHGACTFLDLKVAEDLIRWGVGVDRAGDGGRRAIHIACVNSSPTAAFVEMLIASGCELNAQDGAGNTPLHLAVGVTGYPGGQIAKVRALLTAGARPDVVNEDGEDALTAAGRSRAPFAEEAIRLIREFAPAGAALS